MNITWKNCFRVGLSIFIVFICISYFNKIMEFVPVVIGALTPIFAGAVIAYLLNILMTFYEKHYFTKLSGKKAVIKSRRPVCMIAAILSLCAIIALIFKMVIPELVSCVKFIIAVIPPAIENMLKNEVISAYLPKDILNTLADINWQEYISKLLSWITDGIGGTVSTIVSAVSSLVSAIITAFVGIIFAIYLLIDKDRLIKQVKRIMKNYMKPVMKKKITYFFTVLNDCFRRFIVGQCTEAVILGVLCIIGMYLFRLPYAAMIGTLVGFTALIPVVGAFIGAAIGAVMILTVSPVKALIFLIFLVVLQQLEGNIIYPKVVGNSLGLSAIWVLTAITVGGGILGVPGMLFGVPLTAAIYRFIREDVVRREEITVGDK